MKISLPSRVSAREQRNEQRRVVRFYHHGAGGAGHLYAAALRRADDQRPSRLADAVVDRGGDHARFSDGVHPDGHGHDVRVDRLQLRYQQNARSDGAAYLRRDGERRADFDSAIRVHGVSGRARQPDRETVQESAPGGGACTRLAGGGHHRDVRDFRHCHRHRRRGGHADGAAGVSGDAARGL